jgi:hypothetical protein
VLQDIPELLIFMFEGFEVFLLAVAGFLGSQSVLLLSDLLLGEHFTLCAVLVSFLSLLAFLEEFGLGKGGWRSLELLLSLHLLWTAAADCL